MYYDTSFKSKSNIYKYIFDDWSPQTFQQYGHNISRKKYLMFKR